MLVLLIDHANQNTELYFIKSKNQSESRSYHKGSLI